MRALEQGPGDGEEARVEKLPSVASSLIGASLAELQMHGEARAALLKLLLADPTVGALFDRWTLETQVGQLTLALRDHLARTAQTAGFPHVQALLAALRDATDGTVTLTLDVVDGAEAKRVFRTAGELLEEAADLSGALTAAKAGFDAEPLSVEAVALVRDEWKLPWPWLAWELVRWWLGWLEGAPFGLRQEVQFRTESTGWEHPAPALAFRTTPGESIEDALRRCHDEVVAPLEAAAAAARLPNGRRTRSELVRRNTEWWYRRHIRGESLRSIADKDDDKRSLVRHGIEQAHRWLGIAGWRWKDEADV